MTSGSNVVIKKTEPRAVAFIGCQGPYSQMPDVFFRLFGWIQEKGFIIAGPPSGVYFNSPTEVSAENLLWEIRCPIRGDIPLQEPDASGVGVKKLRSVQVAATLHKGPYDQVGSTYQILRSWIKANGYQIVGPAEEVYLSPPAATSPEEVMTEVRLAVRRKHSKAK